MYHAFMARTPTPTVTTPKKPKGPRVQGEVRVRHPDSKGGNLAREGGFSGDAVTEMMFSDRFELGRALDEVRRVLVTGCEGAIGRGKVIVVWEHER